MFFSNIFLIIYLRNENLKTFKNIFFNQAFKCNWFSARADEENYTVLQKIKIKHTFLYFIAFDNIESSICSNLKIVRVNTKKKKRRNIMQFLSLSDI